MSLDVLIYQTLILHTAGLGKVVESKYFGMQLIGGNAQFMGDIMLGSVGSILGFLNTCRMLHKTVCILLEYYKYKV